MGGIVHAVEAYLEQYGYPVLFLIVFIESFGIPAPGQTLLITAALFAATGKLNLWIVLLTAFAAAVIGDNLGYLIGRQGGHRLLFRYGRHFGLPRRRLRLLQARFERHSGWFVAVARFFDVLRQINGMLAGSAEMGFRRFILFNTLGAALWVALWGFGAYYAGRGLKQWVGAYEYFSTWLVLGVFVLSIGVVGIWFWRQARRRKRGARDGPGGSGSTPRR